MTEPLASLPAPEWIYKRDGRLVSFEADKISHSLFAATETLGQPDSFLARELADSVLHFLATESEGNVPTTTQLADLVVKVVRELGHPALAQTYATARHKKGGLNVSGAVPFERALAELAPSENSLVLLRRLGAANLAPSFLQSTFGRDVQWTVDQGLMTVMGLDAPLELAGWLLGKPGGTGVVEFLEEARGIAGGYVAVDGPEFLLSQPPATYVRELMIGVRTTGLRAVVNLNSELPPPWAGTLAEGPLFGERRQTSAQAQELGDLLWQGDGDHRLRVDWHLGDRDFAPAARGQLTQPIRRALEGARVAFAFDRPRRTVPLAEGIDRQHPAVLLAIRIHLTRLLDVLERRIPSQSCTPELFLQKLSSLARLALSAGVQKRAFLRRLARKWPAFLVERARLVLIPTGLSQVACRLAGEPIGAPAGLQLVRQILQHLHDVFRHESSACHLEACLDSDPFGNDESDVVPWPENVALPQQLKAMASWHKGIGVGTMALIVPHAGAVKNEEVAQLLHWTWKQTDIARLRFVAASQGSRQLTAPWESATHPPEPPSDPSAFI